MFLGSVSTAQERKVRKDTKTKAIAATAALYDRSKLSQQWVDALNFKLPIIYRGNDEDAKRNTDIPKDVIMSYFTTMTTLLLDETAPIELLSRANETGQGLDQVNVSVQTEIMENIFQIEKAYGCRYLALIQDRLADDRELIDAAKAFTLSTLVAFMNALKFRAAKLGHPKRTSGPIMSRITVLEFFEACSVKMVLPETKAALRAEYLKQNKPPNEMIIGMQHEILELLGVERMFGVQCLNRIPQDFPQDQEVSVKMNQFAISAQLACREATQTEEQVKEFYRAIPTYMHYFPQMFVFQQQMQMRHQQQLDAEAQQAVMKSFQDYFTSPEGSAKAQELSQRVELSKQRAQQQLDGFDMEQKKSYFNSFLEHPVLEELNSVGTDPKAKMLKFLEFSENDLDTVLTMQLLIADDIKNGGTLVKELTSTGNGKGLMGGIHTLRTIAGMSASAQAMLNSDNNGSFDHDHSHTHDGQCEHQPAATRAPTTNVLSGKGDAMDR